MSFAATALTPQGFDTPARLPNRTGWNVLRFAVLAHAVYCVPSRRVEGHRLIPREPIGWIDDERGRGWALVRHECEFLDSVSRRDGRRECAECESSYVIALGHDEPRAPGEAIVFRLDYFDDEGWRAAAIG
ncbi:MAG TPA: hypothetical protein PJ986_04615 [Gammaproteobacteria bacterium]|nr:hypothetical protein [Gammaproteobacteria bacterium]